MKKNYIPQNKFDTAAVERLKVLPFEEIKHDAWKLLEWLQDLHWPVSGDIASYLIPYVDDIKEDLIKILKTDDEIWKRNIMITLIDKTPYRIDNEILTILKEIAENPTDLQKEDLVDEAAQTIVAKVDLNLNK